MKTKYLIAILLLSFFNSFMIKAQKFNGGLLFGVCATEISGDYIWGPNKPGIYGGAFVNAYSSEKSSFQMEINFIQKGSRKIPDSSNNYSSYLLRLNYVELFLNYKWDFASRFTFEVGPSFGVLISNYEEADGLQGEYGPPFKSSDLSINAGLYYSLLQNIRLNIRYSNSILPVRKWPGGISYGLNKGQYNEVLSFTIQYQINKPVEN